MLTQDTALVVDDSNTARRMIASTLRDRLNCQKVLEAASGDEALQLLKQNTSIDWIFCDWEMPGMTGEQVLSEVRKDPQTAHIPFMMVTTRNDRDSLVTAVQLGVTAYIVKPFNALTLEDKIHNTRQRMERRNAERVKIKKEQPLALRFSEHGDTPGQLVDVSLSGLLAKGPLEKLRGISIFDTVMIMAKVDHPDISMLKLPAEVIRMEADPKSPGKRDIIRMAFRFNPMESEMRHALADWIDQLNH